MLFPSIQNINVDAFSELTTPPKKNPCFASYYYLRFHFLSFLLPHPSFSMHIVSLHLQLVARVQKIIAYVAVLCHNLLFSSLCLHVDTIPNINTVAFFSVLAAVSDSFCSCCVKCIATLNSKYILWTNFMQFMRDKFSQEKNIVFTLNSSPNRPFIEAGSLLLLVKLSTIIYTISPLMVFQLL